jgi:hypothetical protein
MSISVLLQIKMNSNFNCSYMAMSSLTFILGFSVRFFSASLVRYQKPVIAHLVFNVTSKVDRKWGC